MSAASAQLHVQDLQPRRSKRSSILSFKRHSRLVEDDGRRDSGMADSSAHHTLPALKETAPFGLAQMQHDIPSIVVQDEQAATATTSDHMTEPPTEQPGAAAAAAAAASTAVDGPPDTPRTPNAPDATSPSVQKARAEAAAKLEQPADFRGITTTIPTGELDDPFSSNDMSFSKRGSMLLSGAKADAILARQAERAEADRTGSLTAAITSKSDGNASRPMSTDEVRLSQRVRSMYEAGDEQGASEWQQGNTSSTHDFASPRRPSTHDERPATGQESLYANSAVRANSIMSSRRSSMMRKEPWETAGGIEDWRDVHNEDVDRYGFIRPRSRVASRDSSVNSISAGPGSPEMSHRTMQRPPAGLETVAESGAAVESQTVEPSRSPNGDAGLRHSPPRRSFKTQNTPSLLSAQSYRSNSSRLFRRRSSVNRGRRWADVAGDMLSMEPGQTGVPFDTEDSSSPAKAAKERQREVKWAKMARPIRLNGASSQQSLLGGGQEFTFDTSSAKLVSRTWKGIPDRWRASAWYSFLKTSARRQANLLSTPFVPDSELIAAFHSLQSHACADDAQIDMDVPRTIGAHVMFRRRYRGGQRLLFRLLRALALYFPTTGYVQGMAPLAATLLCYYDEERAFVMAARMWQCRGLAALYAPGFDGLVASLDVFEKRWLSKVANGAVQNSLNQVGVVVPSYGTKWYLTLFAYSVPFAAQLRIWDVFMLLGGMHDAARPDLDVVHAVGAALLDGLQDVLCGAEFENAMRVLTTAVPIGREDVLMQVARREYALRR